MGNIALTTVKNADQEKIEIKDWRGHHITTIDDEFIDKFARVVGVTATCVYMVLCRHSGVERISWPSLELIGDKLGIAKRTVLRAVSILEDHRIIKVDRPKGSHNIYHLLEKAKWRQDQRIPRTRRTPAGRKWQGEGDDTRVTWQGTKMRPMSERR